MKKFHVAILILILILSLSTIYATKTYTVGGIKFEVPDEYINGELYDKNTYHNLDMDIDVDTDMNGFNYEVASAYKNANTKETIDIDGRPAIFITELDKYTKVNSYLIFESNKKLVTISITGKDNIPDSVLEMVKKTPKSTITSTELNDYCLKAFKKMYPDSKFELSSEKTTSISDVSIEIPYKYQFGTITSNLYKYTYDKKIEDKYFSIMVYPSARNTDDDIGIRFDNPAGMEEEDIDGHHVYCVYNKYIPRTSIIFESAGHLIVIDIPYSSKLTDTGRNMVKSTAPATLSKETLQSILIDSTSKYQYETYLEDEMQITYERAYSDYQIAASHGNNNFF